MQLHHRAAETEGGRRSNMVSNTIVSAFQKCWSVSTANGHSMSRVRIYLYKKFYLLSCFGQLANKVSGTATINQ